MKATTFGNLKRNDVFTFNGSKTQWKVTSIKVSEKDGQEYPTHITCSTIGSEVSRTFDLSKNHDYNGTYGATVSDRAVIVHAHDDDFEESDNQSTTDLLKEAYDFIHKGANFHTQQERHALEEKIEKHLKKN